MVAKFWDDRQQGIVKIVGFSFIRLAQDKERPVPSCKQSLVTGDDDDDGIYR